ncbi:MAG: Uma2 family endonuclease [Gemmatimonadales bacterium]
MSLPDWLANGWLARHEPTPAEIADLLAVVERDLADAKIPRLSPDWRLGIAYNAGLQLATLALAAAGYSPTRERAHERAILSLRHTAGVAPRTVDLLDAVRRKRLGWTGLAPADLDLRSGQLTQPDLFVVPLASGREPGDWTECGIPVLIAEVLSPTTARHDRITKRRRYQRSGVATYWIVDPDARLVEIWVPRANQPTIADERLDWRPQSALEPLRIELAPYFAEVWAEP